MKASKTIFELVSVAEKGNVLSKSISSANVSITKKEIFVGSSGNWKLKWKDITKMEIDGMTIFLETDKKTMELVNAEERTWDAFSENMQNLWTKLQEKSVEEEEYADPVLTARPKGKNTKSRGYGTREKAHLRILASAARNERLEDEWSADEKVVAREDPAPTIEVSNEEDDDDEEEEEEETQFTDDGQPSDDDVTVIASEDEEEKLSTPPLKIRRKGRLQKKTFIEDSDDEAFDDAEMTSPGRSRLVTPRPGVNAFIEDDDEEEEEEKEAAMQAEALKNQPKIGSFFDRKKPNSFLSKFAATTKTKKHSSTPPRTPPRTFKSIVPIERTKPLKTNNEKWIEATQNRTPVMTPERETPTTPISPRRVQNSISRRFGKRSSEDIEDIEDSPEPVPQKRARPRFVINGAKVNEKATTTADSSTADDALTLASSDVPHKNPYTIAARKSDSPPATPPLSGSRWKGLYNLGNTCYLNSSLQLLYTVRDFCIRLSEYHAGPLSKSVTAVDRLLHRETDLSSVSPRQLKNAVDEATDRFSGYEQRDAHEFLSDLIDRVHDELEEEVKAKKETAASVTTPNVLTDEFFRMNVKVCLKCDNCAYERTMDEMYRHLSIEVDRHEQVEGEERPKWTVKEGLQKFFQSEQREIKCEKCEEGTTATQTLFVKSRPKALILQLKRFVVKERTRIQRSTVRKLAPDSSSGSDSEKAEDQPPPPVEMVLLKNKDAVVVNKSFDLDQYLPEELKGSKYKLSGIVHHHGGSPSSGHYTTDAVRDDDGAKQWVSFDDGSAYEANIGKILKSPHSQRTAYLLLYTLES